ncbi:MAG: helix-turn-helix domain-containing protein [Actinomycetota bacterium]
MGLREDNAERRRQAILAATRELIARDGVDGWSMRKVAERANLSVPTLYNLFGSKDEIRAALCGGFFESLDETLEADAATPEPVDRLMVFVDKSVDQVLERAATTRPALLAQEQGGGGEHRTTPMAIERQRAAIQQAIDAGHLRNELRSELLATQSYDGFHRAAVLWARGKLDPETFRARALYSACVCLLAVATEAARPELVRTANELEGQLASDREPALAH